MPVTKNSIAAAMLPAHAKPAMMFFFFAERSAAAPTMGRTNAERTVAAATV